MILSERARDILEFSRKKNLTDFNLMERILIYCEENELDVAEVGEEIKADKMFKTMLEDDLKANHYIRSKDEKKEADLSDWG